MIRKGDVLTNAVTGERLTFLATSAETDGRYLEWEDEWPEGHHRGSAHVHPAMEERWQVLEGHASFEIGTESRTVRVGDVVVAPPGVPHLGWNVGDGPVRLRVRMTPARRWAEVVERLFALAEQGRVDENGTPPVEDLVALMRDFSEEIAPPPRRNRST